MLAETGVMLKKSVWTIASKKTCWFFNKILRVLNNKLANLLEETTSFKVRTSKTSLKVCKVYIIAKFFPTAGSN